MPPLPAPPADQLVTSSDLVRHFGLWQERAARAPLYILHRGRPRFVMTSIETMEALCAPHTPASTDLAAAPAIDAIALLDSISDLVLVADAAGAIIATSRAARAHFGSLAAIGASIAAIAPAGAAVMLSEAIRRVIACGIGDRLEIASAARSARALLLTIEPARRGVTIIAQDVTIERDLARAEAIERAFVATLSPTAATATINSRGYLAETSPELAALTGLDRPALAQSQFVTLVEPDGRDALATAVERALAGEAPPVIETVLKTGCAAPLAVRIGLAPIRNGPLITGTAAIIIA